MQRESRTRVLQSNGGPATTTETALTDGPPDLNPSTAVVAIANYGSDDSQQAATTYRPS